MSEWPDVDHFSIGPSPFAVPNRKNVVGEESRELVTTAKECGNGADVENATYRPEALGLINVSLIWRLPINDWRSPFSRSSTSDEVGETRDTIISIYFGGKV